MSLTTQLKWANFWSVIGMVPFALVFSVTLIVFASDVFGHHPSVPMLDPIGMVGLLVMTWLFMVAVAGPQLWWAWRITSYDKALKSPTARVLRVTGVVLVSGPFVLVQAMIHLR